MNSPEEKKIVSIMKENCIHSYLATSDGDQPRVRPVTPIVEDDMSIWVTTGSSSRKVKQLRENPKVCLSFVEHPIGDRAAMVIGEAQIIPDIEQKRRVWKLAPFDLYEYFHDGPDSDEFCLLKIVIKRIEWREKWIDGEKIYKPTQQ